MRAIVGVKRVIDYTVKIRVKQDGSGVEKNSVKMSINPFCEIAVEEAVRLKEKGIVKHITALSIGDKNSTETLKHALAIGADDAIHVVTSNETDLALNSINVCNIFKHFVNKDNYNLVLLGKQSIDSDFNQTGQMLSGMLDWQISSFANKVEKQDEKFVVTRETDSGLQKLNLTSPMIITCDLRLNTPRYLKLTNITAAKKKPINTFKIEDIITLSNPVKVLKVESPPVKKQGVIVSNVDELINKLKNEAKLI